MSVTGYVGGRLIRKVLPVSRAAHSGRELLRERVAKLEVQMAHLSRWVIVGLAGVAGLASGLVAKLIP
jgi:hypothetical protein